MRRRLSIVTRSLGLALCCAVTPVNAADTSNPAKPLCVVMNSLSMKMTVNGNVLDIDARHRFQRFRVERASGDSFWLLADDGFRGSVNRRDVVPIDQAVARFTDEIKHAPRPAAAFYLRGLTYLIQEQSRRAIRDLSESMRLDPAFGPAYVARAQARIASHDLNGAVADANKSIQLDPSSSRAHEMYSIVLRARGEYKLSLEEIDRAIQLAPGDATLFETRALTRSVMNEYDPALADIARALRLEPTLIDAYHLRATVWCGKKDARLAIDALNAVIRIDPQSIGAYYERSLMWCALKDYDRALADCDQAMRLDPHPYDGHTVRGMVLAMKGEIVPALGEWVFHPLPPSHIKINLFGSSKDAPTAPDSGRRTKDDGQITQTSAPPAQPAPTHP
jgi:tetratricopeptide (TPR) repeat protein